MAWTRRCNTPAGMLLIVANLLPLVRYTMAASSHVRVRQTQEELPAYRKCFDTLDSITGGGITLSQSQYVTFLSQIVEGSSVSASTEFKDLDAIYILIFYMTACEDPSRCTPSMSPQSIPIGDTANPTDNLRLLCRTVLREGETNIDASFQYSIQYDAGELDDSKLGECLSTATVNVLLDLLGCEPMGVSNNRRRRREEVQSNREEVQSTQQSLSLQDFVDLLASDSSSRRDLQVGEVVSSEDEDCPYMVSSSVDRINELEMCEEGGADVGIENEAVECGLVTARATVSTTQFEEPFATVLRSRIISALEEAINNGNFLQFFPSGAGCFVNE